MNADPVLSEIPILRTPRLRLRPLATEDALAVFELYSSPVVMAWNVFPPFRRIDEAEDLLRYHALLFESRRGIRWALTSAKDKTLIGTCGYHNWQQSQREAELSYELAPEYWRQGLMTEAVRSVLDFGLRQMALSKIRARVMKENAASIQLLKNSGFRQNEANGSHFQNGREVCEFVRSAGSSFFC